jgi:cysteine-rich repeat protein
VSGFCGNGLKEGTEECDDGDTLDNGCSSLCKITLPYTCGTALPSVCTYCGDGKVLLTETCDDGSDDGIGCASGCTSGVVDGWVC